jgi:1-deoxy-D-xylulose 5-phosphate reductoisomerase
VKRLLILGSTGSIGTQALDVVSRAPEAFEVVGLSAARDHETVLAQAREHGVKRIALADPDAARSCAGRTGSSTWSPSRARTWCSTRSWAPPASGRRSSR